MALFTPGEILRNLKKNRGEEPHVAVPSPQKSYSSTNVRRGRAVLAAGLALSLAALVGCGQSGPSTAASGGAASLDKLKETKEVSVGFANERPYAYLDGDKLVGQAPALSGYIFDQLGGIKLDPRLFEFGSLIQALNSNRVDVVTAGMYITPARCKQANFGNPEYVATTALLVKKGNPLGLSDYASVAANAQAKLAVLNGGVEPGHAKANGVPADRLQVVADQQSGLDAVKSGRADAVASTAPALRALVKADPSVEVLEGFVPVIDGKKQVGVSGAVFRKGDEDLRKAYNEELKKLIESGKWLELLEPYGFTKAEMPDPAMTAEQYCQE
ncbi:ectoine/hydroxyectoine ABC transporter substrate-binding protein EhuB [Paenarthrobacter ilicis]|uniref:ectoine/hydroxyectoine ABC transporter substrate-binding protein EhuB n=1 Tax=Paenarthrobacter ilicis TaxID=43665 RepID=UPI0028D0474B|nr:ectoine/hydroxyectoine ABC transporter substrate-binding protein EhuB [Paenarthrobacter ilicis]